MRIRGLERRTGLDKSPVRVYRFAIVPAWHEDDGNMNSDSRNITRRSLSWLLRLRSRSRLGSRLRLLGDDVDITVSVGANRRVLCGHLKALLRATAHAHVAHNATEVIDGPSASRAINDDCVSRASTFACATNDAVAFGDLYFTFQTSRCLFFLHGVQDGLGLLENRPDRHLPQTHESHDDYLSVQLTQGSIVRIMLLTSATSQPFRDTAIPARF